ncbi:hypothetical protein BOX15_Mlig001691g2 [Macrostomum lignano]|uniref:E1 domain-containing protein n=1 Tax=Macrostomum lignano TaxID=282301 RepID=A0A267GW89_9PLAT|nr:hypothetical protein BOX15_Mlig001691g2 [Macrostomum lignano]
MPRIKALEIILSVLLCLAATAAALSSVVAVDSSNSRQQQQQQQQHQHQVAFACPTDSAENTDDLPAVVWLSDPAGGPGRWHADPRLTGCPATPSKQLEFCRLAYPHVKNIINVAPAAETVPVPNWCPSGSSALDCPARTVTPQLCLTSDFKSDALLLPPNCRFDHRSADNPRNPDECRTFTQWRQVARARCASVGEVLRTHSLLLPCSAAGKFAGVEFVCCPETSAVPFAVPSVEDRDREIVQVSLWPAFSFSRDVFSGYCRVVQLASPL